MKSRVRISLFALMLVFIITCSVFVSCNDFGSSDTTTAANAETTATTIDPNAPLDIDLLAYNIVYPESWDATAVANVKTLSSAIEKATGGFANQTTDKLADGVTAEQIAATKEILIGNTNRPESAQALADAPANAYVIAVIGNKLVINSNVIDFTFDAISYFNANYVSAAVNGVLSLTAGHKYTSDPTGEITLVDNSKTSYKIIYRDGLDAENGVDVEVGYAQTLQKAVKTHLNTTIQMVSSGSSKLSREILVGNVDCDETRLFLKNLAYDEYGFGVVGNKIVVAGWNYVTTKLAVNQFSTYLKNNRVNADSGKYSLSIPYALSEQKFTYKSHKWELDFPAYDGGIVKGSSPSADGFLVQITNTNANEYNAYCEKLASSGYTKKATNEIGANKYALYTGSANNVYVYYIDAFKTVRIVTSGSDVKFPTSFTAESVPAYNKIATTTVTQMKLDYSSGSFGMCYIILLEDGTFIVFDGGYKGNDPAKLYETLKKLNPRTDGKIVISAWFLTHEHRDHFNVFRDFCKTYGQNGNKVQVKAAYVNFNDESMWGNMVNSANHFLSDSTTYNTMSKAVGGMEIITVRTGMEFYICNAKVEILYTEEDHFPNQLNDFNDTSTVSRVTLAGQTFLFLGDASYVSQDNMIEMYGKELKSDIVQLSHHGWDGNRLALYKLVKPHAVFWPGSSGEHKTQSADYNVWLRKNTKIQWNQSQTTTITPPYKYGQKFDVSY